MTTLTATRSPGPSAWIFRALAGFYRRQADRLDPGGATQACNLTFTFEPGIGVVVRSDNRGCRLGWPAAADLTRATAEAGPPREAAGWVWLPRYADGGPWPPDGYEPPGQPPLWSWPASGLRPAAVTLRTGDDGQAR